MLRRCEVVSNVLLAGVLGCHGVGWMAWGGIFACDFRIVALKIFFFTEHERVNVFSLGNSTASDRQFILAYPFP